MSLAFGREALFAKTEKWRYACLMKNGDKGKAHPLWEAVALGSRLGFSIALPLSLLTVGGVWADKALRTQPAFLIAGVLLGLTFAGYAVWRVLARFSVFK